MTTAPAGRRFRAAVAEIRDETPAVRTFRLALPPGEAWSFVPGQFVRVRFPDETDARDYSLSSSPADAGHFEITFAKAGAFTARLFGLKAGGALDIEGPYGRWRWSAEPRRLVLISGGTGIAPFRSMILGSLAAGARQDIALFYSVRTPADIVFRRQLDEFRRSGVAVHTFVTRPGEMPAGERWEGPTGRITLEEIRGRVAELAEATCYLCGPSRLVSDLSRALLEGGLPKEQVRSERWGEF